MRRAARRPPSLPNIYMPCHCRARAGRRPADASCTVRIVRKVGRHCPALVAMVIDVPVASAPPSSMRCNLRALLWMSREPVWLQKRVSRPRLARAFQPRLADLEQPAGFRSMVPVPAAWRGISGEANSTNLPAPRGGDRQGWRGNADADFPSTRRFASRSPSPASSMGLAPALSRPPLCPSPPKDRPHDDKPLSHLILGGASRPRSGGWCCARSTPRMQSTAAGREDTRLLAHVACSN